jgi:hypothetical protein
MQLKMPVNSDDASQRREFAFKHVLLVWELGGNRGHLERLQVAALDLRAQGVRCTFVVRLYASSQAWLEQRGWDCLPAPDPVPEAVPSAQHDRAASSGGSSVHCHADWFLRMGFGQEGMARQLIDGWESLLKTTGADAALLDFAPSAAYALHFLGLPFLTLGTGFCSPSDLAAGAGRPDCFSPWDQRAAGEALVSHRRLQAIFGSLRARLGAAAAEQMLQLFTPERVALCTFAAFDPWQRSAAHSAYHGVIWALSHQAVLNWHQEDRRLRVFCYLNAEPDFVMAWLGALHALRLDLIAVTPSLTDMQMQAFQRPDFQLIRTPLDIASLLKSCGGCITLGGVSLSGASLWHGVPLLILPRYAEHALLARRLTTAKLATTTVQAPTPALAAAKLADLQSHALQANAQAFAAAHASHSPQKTVASALAMLSQLTVAGAA